MKSILFASLLDMGNGFSKEDCPPGASFSTCNLYCGGQESTRLALRNQISSEQEAKAFFQKERDFYHTKWVDQMEELKELRQQYRTTDSGDKQAKNSMSKVIIEVHLVHKK